MRARGCIAARFYRSSDRTHIWYISGHEVIDYSTDTEETRSYHLVGFTTDEQREIFASVRARARRL